MAMSANTAFASCATPAPCAECEALRQLEPPCGRERSGSPQAKSRAERGTSTANDRSNEISFGGAVDRQRRRPGQPRQLEPGEILPMLRTVPRLTALQPIGRYAVRPLWDDGHGAGDFTWEFLRDICSCAEC